MVNTLAGGSGECEWPVSQISLKMSSLIPAKQVEQSCGSGGGCDFSNLPC